MKPRSAPLKVSSVCTDFVIFVTSCFASQLNVKCFCIISDQSHYPIPSSVSRWCQWLRRTTFLTQTHTHTHGGPICLSPSTYRGAGYGKDVWGCGGWGWSSCGRQRGRKWIEWERGWHARQAHAEQNIGLIEKSTPSIHALSYPLFTNLHFSHHIRTVYLYLSADNKGFWGDKII